MSATIYIKCPHCGASGMVPESLLGVKAPCNACQKPFVVAASPRKRGEGGDASRNSLEYAEPQPVGRVDKDGKIYLDLTFGLVFKLTFFVMCSLFILSIPLAFILLAFVNR